MFRKRRGMLSFKSLKASEDEFGLAKCKVNAGRIEKRFQGNSLKGDTLNV
jgi:hypothetical protein